jgi:hypothetical protein
VQAWANKPDRFRLNPSHHMPGHTTILAKAVVGTPNTQLELRDLVIKAGTMIDATLVEVDMKAAAYMCRGGLPQGSGSRPHPQKTSAASSAPRPILPLTKART